MYFVLIFKVLYLLSFELRKNGSLSRGSEIKPIRYRFTLIWTNQSTEKIQLEEDVKVPILYQSPFSALAIHW